MLNKIIKAITNPPLLFVHICRHRPFTCISDRKYLELFFRAYQGKKLNLENPLTFNEKLQWLKLYDRDERYKMMTDKYLVREYVSSKIGERYLIPLIGVWNSTKEIDFDKMPSSFVLKCNHDSGSVIVCKDKKELDIKKACKQLEKSLHTDYYWKSREYNYKGISPKIIAEYYMTDDSGMGLRDYKIFCFRGEPKFIQVDTGRFTNHVRNLYLPNWEFIPVEFGHPNDPKNCLPKPKQLEEMLSLAKVLAKDIPHVRVDFYISNGKIYFGELTFHHGGGSERVNPEYYDLLWGSYIMLPEEKKDKNV